MRLPVIIVHAPLLLKKDFSGMAIFPFVFIKHPEVRHNQTVINHEKIHLMQEVEMLWIGFFIWYLLEFMLKWILYRNMWKAYRNISFEREAYAHEGDFLYIKNRRMWHFLRYL